MSDGSEIRVFLAIEPPEAVRDAMALIQGRLKKTVLGPLSWARTSGMHLTLKFFGNIGASDIAPISSAVGEAIAGYGPMRMEIKGLGVFPDIRRPRVLWLGTNGDVDRLGTLQQALETGLEPLGFEREDRPFRAHWTLARIKSPRDTTGIAQAVETGGELHAGAFTADKLILFKSDLTPKGAIYTRLAQYALQG